MYITINLFFHSSTCIYIEERNTCVWQPYTQEKLYCTYICNVDELRLISICLLCIIHRILLFIFSEADTEDSQRSTDANIDLGHMKMIFFGNRKIWHISIYRTFTKIIHLLSHCIIKIYICKSQHLLPLCLPICRSQKTKSGDHLWHWRGEREGPHSEWGYQTTSPCSVP